MSNDQINSQNKLQSKFSLFIKDTLQTVATALVMTFIIYNFISKPNQVRGESMEPNIKPRDFILTNQMKDILIKTGIGNNLNLNYDRGDIVILRIPGEEPYIKRIVAGPGDIIEIRNSHLIVNNKVLIEKYLTSNVITTPGDFLREGEAKEVPGDNYFVMGDNRTRSLDSRYMKVGFVPKQYIIGPASLRIWPFEKFGFLASGEYNEIPVNEYDFENDDSIEIDMFENIQEQIK